MSKFLTVDTETAGKDFFHSSRPFIVTTCTSDGAQWLCEWNVDPLTRKVKVDPRDCAHLRELIASYETIVFHNSKFDIKALATVGVSVPWSKVEDTLVASHVLHSSAPHNLTDLASAWLNENIAPYEVELEKAVKTARRRVSSARLKDKRGSGSDRDSVIARWRIAEEGMSDLPIAKGGGADGEGKLWRNDYWLPAAFVRYFPDDPEFKGWREVVTQYANIDSSVTALLWPVLRDQLIKRGHWKIYRAKFAATPAAYRMEQRGVTLNLSVMRELQEQYTEEAEELAGVCVGIARSYGYALELPQGPTNGSLDDFVFGRAVRPDGRKRDAKLPRLHAADTLNLRPVKETESGAPSFDSDARDMYLAELDPTSKAYCFVESFGRRCELDTGLSYLAGYERFLVSENGQYVLHPNMNTVGTATTRWSHSNPNSANVSERSVVNARSCFCPGPGREWYSLDAAGIELIIPAKRANEEEVLDVMMNPDKPPYYGSYHLFVFDILHPELFAKYGKNVKTECKREYSETKNFNFCRQYGGGEAKGDATARVKGASRRVGSRLSRIDALSKQTIAQANATGRVVTVPDKSVDPDHGYPIMCRRGAWGNISPTVPFAYFVSGTAGWWLNRAVVRCDEQLERWREEEGYDGYMILSVHDELVFDLPLDKGDNIPRVHQLRRLMEQGGTDMGIPTPVKIERHIVSWAVGEEIK